MNDDGKRQVDAYLAGLDREQRELLQAIREMIRSIVPEATEGLSYRLPAFFLGKAIAGYGASKKHCSYYPMSGSVIEGLSDELADYQTSKGAVRIPNGGTLPMRIVRRLIKARIAEIS